MSAFDPTPAQRRAIETVGLDLCVTAGAGCGKTFTLARRFHHLVAAGHATVGEILAITFTEKAAAEMKGRIADLFEEGGRERERRDVEGAAVSTIHAFCARLLREHAIEAGLDPRFAVLDEVEADRLRRQALREASEVWRQERADELAALSLVRAARLSEDLLDLHERVRAAGEDPSALEAGEPPALDGPRRAFREAVASVEAETSRPTPAVRAKLEVLREAAGRLDGEDPWATCLEAREKLKGARAATFGEARAALDSLLAALADRRAQPAVEAIVGLLADVDGRYREQKAESGWLDFADLEILALDLLESRPGITEEVRARHPHLLVDEMQDVSRVQARLLDALRAPGGCFCVGDVKQSIYGFRHADVGVILEERDRVGEEGRIVLAETFRARAEILGVVDEVFGPMWPEGQRIELEPLVARGTFLPCREPCVEVLLVEDVAVDPARRREAERIADRLVAFVERGALTLTKGGEARGVRWRDVAILLRATRDVKIYERALLDRDVPYHVLGGRGFWEAREIVDLANLLRVIAGPGEDEVALAAVLRSPVVGLTDESLLRVFGRPDRRGPLPPAVEGLPDREARRLAAFADLRDELRAMRGRAPLAALVDRAIEGSGLGERVLVQRNGRQRLANLRKILALARELDGKGLFSLAEFVDLVDERRDLTIREAEAPAGAEAEDAVTIMTVHGAKGLEFPVVFVPDLARKAPSIEPAFRWAPGERPAVQVWDGSDWVKTPGTIRLRDAEREADRAESRRLLYVAMTRAAEHLVLSAAYRPDRVPDGCWLGDVLGGLGLDRAEIPAGVSTAGPASGPVRVDRSPVSEREASGMRPPLARTHRAMLEDLRPLGLEGEPEALEEAERLVAAADLPFPEEDRSDYLVTVTEVLTWARSPEEWRLRYRLGRRDWSPAEAAGEGVGSGGGSDEGAVGGRSAAARGRAAHRFLEVVEAGAAADEARDLAERFLREEGLDGDRETATLLRWAKRFHRGEVGRMIRESPRVRRETPFLLRLPVGPGGGTLLRGTIDLLVRTLTGDWLVDHKAGRIAEEGDETGLDYRLQMRLYAMAMEEVMGRRPARALLWSLPEARAIDVDLDDTAMSEASAVLERFTRAASTP